MAKVFLAELLRSGTTAALAFCTVHKVRGRAVTGASKKKSLKLVKNDGGPRLLQGARGPHAPARAIIIIHNNKNNFSARAHAGTRRHGTTADTRGRGGSCAVTRLRRVRDAP